MSSPKAKMETFGPYELIERLAVGGMAEIFLARRCGPGGFAKLIALKRVLPELARQDAFRQMFADEARLCASLSHPGLVQVFDYGEEQGSPFLVMEWVDGCDLATVLETGGAIEASTAAFLVAEVARALDYVHGARDEQGRPLQVVHRDLSPGNVLISREGDVKLGDFGVAKARGRLARTESGQLKGTLAYLTPEQASGGVVDVRTDVYALGLLLFELLTGERYLRGEGEVALLKEAANPTPRSVGELLQGVPAELEAALGRALSVEPERRHPTAAAFELDLRRACESPPLSRAALGERVARATGQASTTRRQTEMVCLEPETGSPSWLRAFGRRVGPVPLVLLALLAVGLVSAIAVGLLPAAAPRAPTVQGGPHQPAAPRKAPPMPPGRPDDSGAETLAAAPHPERDAGAPPSEPEAGPDSALAPRPARTTPARRPSGVDAGPAAQETVDSAPPEAAEAEPPAPSGPSPSTLLAAVDGGRRRRGLVPGDDAELDLRRARAVELIAREAPAEQSNEAVEAYRQRLEAITIDRAFVDGKMRRVSQRIEASRPSGPRAEELSALSQQALRRAMAGDYEAANRVLNQILSGL